MRNLLLLVCSLLLLTSPGCIYNNNNETGVSDSSNSETSAPYDYYSESEIHYDPDTKSTTIKENVELRKAKEIKTEISFLAGELNISPTAKKLSEGIYKYNNERRKPEISYSEDKEMGYLKIKSTGENENIEISDSTHSEWNIALNKKIENDLSVKFAGGTASINLKECNLKRFEFKMLAGEAHVNLQNTSVPNLNFKALAGAATIDLSGEWDNDLHANIVGGVGEITLILPSDEGIKLSVQGLLGDVNTPLLKKNGNTYTNSFYGNTNETLHIDLTGIVGDVNIQWAD